jgi:hypothetical protein
MSRKVRAICLGAVALVVIPGSIAALAAGSAKPNVHVSCTLGGTSVITWANYVTGSLQAEYTNKPYLHEHDGRSGEIDAPIINVAHRGARGQITVTTPTRVPKGWYLDEVDLWSRTKGRGAMVSLYPIRLCTRPVPPKPPVPTISVAVANNTVLQALGAPINNGAPILTGSPISVSYQCSTSAHGCVGSAPANTVYNTPNTTTFAKVLPVTSVPTTVTAGTANVTLTITSSFVGTHFNAMPNSGTCTIKTGSQGAASVDFYCAIKSTATITVTSALTPV